MTHQGKHRWVVLDDEHAWHGLSGFAPSRLPREQPNRGQIELSTGRPSWQGLERLYEVQADKHGLRDGGCGAIFHLTSVVSGHTVKHLLGAGAVGVLAAMLARRQSLTVLPDLSWAPPGPGVRPAGEG